MGISRRHLKAAFAKQGKAWEEAAHDRRRTTGQSFAHVWHEIAISEFQLSVWESVQAQPAWKLSALERRSLIKHPAFEIDRRGCHRLVPDGMFLVQTPKGRILSFLEIDTGTESERQLARKLESYQIWSESRSGQEYLCDVYRQAGATNPKPHFRLLFVIAPKVIGSEESRIQLFHQLMADQIPTMQKRIWYASTEQLRETMPTNLLRSPIWFRGTDLIESSANMTSRYAFLSD